jgi:hypothetical protein
MRRGKMGSITLFVYTKTVHNLRGNKCAFIYFPYLFQVVKADGGEEKGEKKTKEKVKKEEKVSAKYEAGTRPGDKKDVKVRKYRISNNLKAVL